MAAGRLLRVRQSGEQLEFEGASRPFVERFFSLDVPLGEITQTLEQDAVVRRALREFAGLRLLRQDPWECLLSFVCSSACHIPRIKGCLSRLAEAFGTPLVLGNSREYSLPRPGQILDHRRLGKVRLGFRAAYVAALARRVDEEELRSLAKRPFPEARARLLSLEGVGEKVADCVSLFSLGFMQAFPVDTWIRRGMRRFYFDGEPVSDGVIREFARSRFGSFAGYAQEYLYCYFRERRHLLAGSPGRDHEGPSVPSGEGRGRGSRSGARGPQPSGGRP